MGRPIGPRKVHRYSVEFKLTAVRLSSMPEVQVQTLANALDVHPLRELSGCRVWNGNTRCSRKSMSS